MRRKKLNLAAPKERGRPLCLPLPPELEGRQTTLPERGENEIQAHEGETELKDRAQRRKSLPPPQLRPCEARSGWREPLPGTRLANNTLCLRE